MKRDALENIRQDSEYEARIFDVLLANLPLTKKANEPARLSFSSLLDGVSSMDYVFSWKRRAVEELANSDQKIIISEQGYYFIATHIYVMNAVQFGVNATPCFIKVFNNINGFSLFNKPLTVDTFGIPRQDNTPMHRGISDPYEIPAYYFGERGQIGVALTGMPDAGEDSPNIEIIVSGIKFATNLFKV